MFVGCITPTAPHCCGYAASAIRLRNHKYIFFFVYMKIFGAFLYFFCYYCALCCSLAINKLTN